MPKPARESSSPIPATPRGVRSSAASAYPESVTRLIDELAKLPGIGRRSAERLAFHILKTPAETALLLARAISDVKAKVRHCERCYNLADSAHADSSLCAICADPARDHALIMVVEQPKDLIALEHTGAYRGVYHVLMGRISPLEGVGPGDITILDLLDRIDEPSKHAGVDIREIVLALNPTLESEGTALYLSEQLATRPHVKLTRLARGVPSGAQLEFASKAVLADAIEGRRSF